MMPKDMIELLGWSRTVIKGGKIAFTFSNS